MNAIETKNLTKQYKNKLAVNDLNLEIKKGELFSLLGINGAGKTTTIKMLTGLILPTTGDIKINEMDLKDNSFHIKKILNVSPQETSIAPNLTIKENLEFMAGVYGIVDKEKRISELVKLFHLEEYLDIRCKKLSGGIMRKVSIAISLINDPEILFLDEPTLGLDVISRKELWRVIESMKGKKTIILTTHYMEEAEALSDRIGIICNGNLVDVGTSKELIRKTKTKNIEDAFIKIVTEEANNENN